QNNLVRESAAEALGKIRSERAVGPLIKLLLTAWIEPSMFGPPRALEDAVARSLRRIRLREASTPLLELLKAEPPSFRTLGRELCEDVAAPDPIILDALKLPYEDPTTRTDILWLAHYWGGGKEKPEVLCNYFGRSYLTPYLPRSIEEARRDLKWLQEVWE